MHVVATAGHVDHGKSALVKALSGIDPDRLKEEQARQMTIDLGFAWASLPDGETIGIIDVPGHEDFVENMLAGVGGIDAVLFVVAADEGPKPQTVEHAEILGLLRVACGVVALTKVDLVREAGWLLLVEQEVTKLLLAAGLPAMPQVPVSSISGQGLEALRLELAHALAGVPQREDRGRPRLAVDRVFSMGGFGTVATGTLTDGALRTGQDVEIAPGAGRARIRGLQTHGEQVSLAPPGRRLAVNLSGVDVSEVRRGDVLMSPSGYPISRRVDVRLSVLPTADTGVVHGETIKVFHGTARRMGRLRLLEGDWLPAGAEGWAQLELESPLVANPRDRLILRRPSPARTIAGAQIADMQPARRHRRGDRGVLAALERAVSVEVADRLLASAEKLGLAPQAEIVAASGLESEAAAGGIASLLQDGRLVRVGGDSPDAALIASSLQGRAWESVEAAMVDHQRRYPLRTGMPKEELRSKVGLDARLFAAVLDIAERQGLVEREGARVRQAGAVPELSPEQQLLLRRFLARVAANRFSPMSVKEAKGMLGDELYQLEVERGDLVQVSGDVFFDALTYGEMVGRLRQASAGGDGISVADVRDLFHTSRKYALALMEHLDEAGITTRTGDLRQFRDRATTSDG